jgi:glycosyltransferase involved in cell wall biosynthesis
MRVGVVSPLFESVPPRYYGGTERVVSYLTEELVAQGHDVTLFASGDSLTSARLEPVIESGLRLSARPHDPILCHLNLIERVIEAAPHFDVIHFHIDFLHFGATRRAGFRHLTTMHGRLDLPDIATFSRRHREVPLVSISDNQREPLPWANWIGTVHHGLPPDLYTFEPKRGEYLAFVGRISPEKRPDRAIAIAQRCGIPLRIAAKVDPADKPYFETHIQPLLDAPGIDFVGEIAESEKNQFLGGALALLFPVDWPEPFGLVMIEAMACGTPVIAYRRGSIPEVMEEGITGYVVESEDEAVAAVKRARGLDRAQCRAVFDRRFTAARMARDYVSLYQRLLEAETAARSCGLVGHR